MAKQGLTTQAAILGVGRLLNMAAAAATLMVLARVLPDRESYGAICQLIVLYMVLSQVFAVGLPQSTYYFLPRYEGGEKRGFLTQTLLLLMGSGILMGIGFYVGADWLGAALGSPSLPPLLRVFSVYPAFMLPTLALEGVLMNQQRPVANVTFAAVQRLAMFAALVLPILAGGTLMEAVTAWTVVSMALFTVAVAMMLSSVRGAPFCWRPEMLHDEWHFSAPLALTAVIGLTGIYLDRFLVSWRFGAEGFGIYTNATLEIPTVTMVTNATSVVLLAEFARRISAGEMDKVMPLWHRAMVKSAVLVYASLGFLAFWGHETMRLLFSDRFADSGTIFSIYVWIIPVQMLVGQTLMIAMGATRVMTMLTIVGLGIDVVLLLGLGYLFALPGLALGVVLARYVGGSVSMYWFAYRMTDIRARRLLPWRQLGQALLIAIAAGGLSQMALWLAGAWPLLLRYLVGLCVFLALYGAGMLAAGLLGMVVPARYLPARWRAREEAII